jgi:alkylated DNA repair dioxygenase AlkB
MQQQLWQSEPETFGLPDASIRYQPNFVPDHQQCFSQLFNQIDWQQDKIQMYGKLVTVPRLTAWYGDAGTVYSYSGLHLQAKPWLPVLETIKNSLNRQLGSCFNSVLVNLYRDGKDSVAWHSDNEPELGEQPLIASVSLGATRRFSLRHKHSKQQAHFDLAGGSLLLMAGDTQHYWQHQIAKSRNCDFPRINLTYRRIVSDSVASTSGQSL